MTTTPLDRRRQQASTAANAADKAQTGVTELDNRLQTNANLTAQQSQALKNAVAEVSRLKRSLKVGAKERDRLTKARKKAVTRAATASAKAKAADDKYSKSVLADLVRREKEKAGRGLLSAVPDPAPERPNAAVAAATRTAAATTRTAARKTASAAGSRTPQTQ